MEVKRFAWEIVDSNSWLIVENECGLIIDAVDNVELYNAIAGLKSITIILTHSHFDHIVGLNKIRNMCPDISVITTEKCSKYLGNIYRNMSSSATAFMKFYEGGKKDDINIKPFICAPANLVFEDKIEFTWQSYKIELISVYGHSDDSLIAVINGESMFSGDTLLGVPTITRFPTGSSKRFWLEDIPLLRNMSKQLIVYPGHGDIGKIEEMLEVNKVPERFRECIV